jgi:diacylglycerol kinase family enzyme
LKIFGHDKKDDKVELFRDIPSLIKSEVLPTDLIEWGVNYALCSCQIGMNSRFTKRLKDMKTGLRKGYLMFSRILSFMHNILISFNRQLAAREYNVLIDNVDYSGQYSLIHVANVPFLDGKKTGIPVLSSPSDGLLDITLIRASHPLRTLISIGRYNAGKHPGNSIFIQGKQISVQSKNQMWIQLDNEYIQDTKINLNVVNHAIQIATPEGLSYPAGVTSTF